MSVGAKKSVSLFYDVVSPYSWFAFEALCRYRTQWPSMDLKLKPTFLGGIMKGTGNRPPMTLLQKAIYMDSDLRRLANHYQMKLQSPNNLEEVLVRKGSLNAMRFITAAIMLAGDDVQEPFARELWHRIWGSDQDILAVDSIKAAGLKAGLDSALLDKAAEMVKDDDVKKQLMSNTQEVLDCGAFGLPTIIVGDPKGDFEMLFGSDRMHILADILGEKYVGPLNHLSKL